MNTSQLIIILVIILFFLIISNSEKENFYIKNSQLITQEIAPNTLFNFISSNGLNLNILDGNFYLTNGPGYNFTGLFENNGVLLKLTTTDSSMDLTLNYNQTTPSKSQIVPTNIQIINNDTSKNIFSGNTNQKELNNLFSLQNNKIYYDPINKVIESNDNEGTTIYLQNTILGNPLTWNYNIFNGMIFDYNIVKQ